MLGCGAPAVSPQQGALAGNSAFGEQQPPFGVAGVQQPEVASARAEPTAIGRKLQTPVSGNSNSTRAAAAKFPVSCAAIERTCS